MSKWNGELEFGYPKIDNHHRVFLITINSFFEKSNEGIGSKGHLEGFLYFLTDYVETHFAEEEKLQKEINYSNYDEHKQVHQQLKEELEKIKKKYWELVQDSSDIFLIKLFITNLKENLIDKWINHTKNEDRLIFANYDENAI